MPQTTIPYNQWERKNREKLTTLYRKYLRTEVLPSENRELLLSTENYEAWTKEKYKKTPLL